MVQQVRQIRTRISKLNDRYDSLKPQVRQAMYQWIQTIYVESQKMPVSTPANPLKINQPYLELMSRFLLQSNLTVLSKVFETNPNPLCDHFKGGKNNWTNFYDLNEFQANILYHALQSCSCDVTRIDNITRLGQLACFYPPPSTNLSKDAMSALFSLLQQCKRDVKDIYAAVLSKMTVSTFNTADVGKLGNAVVGLSEQQLSSLGPDILNGSLDSFAQQPNLTKVQKLSILNTIPLDGIIKVGNLKSLGLLTDSLQSDTLIGINSSLFRTAFGNSNFTQALNSMQPVQKKAILLSILKDTSLKDALLFMPASLITEVPSANIRALQILNKNWANFTWNKAQALAVMEKAFPLLKTPNDIQTLQTAAKGLTCKQICNLTKAQLVTLSSNQHLSRDQVRCASKAYIKFKDVSNMTDAELSLVPSNFLVFTESFTNVMSVTMPRCRTIVARFANASTTLLPKDSMRRTEILYFILNCFNRSSLSALSPTEMKLLGGVVCLMGEQDITAMNDSQFQATLDQLATCGEPEDSMKIALQKRIIALYGDIPQWTPAVVSSLRSLVKLFDFSKLYMLPVSLEMKDALAPLLSHTGNPQGFIPRKLDFKYDIESLNKEYGKMVIELVAPNNRARRDICSSVVVPSPQKIREMGDGNSVLTPLQLECLSPDTFSASVDVLASVPGFSDVQLSALKTVALKAYPLLTDQQLGSLKKIALAFTWSDVNKYIKKPSIDTLSSIGQYSEWLDNLSVAKEILATFLRDNPVKNLTSRHLLGLGYFMCAFTPDQIAQLSSTEYSAAAYSIGQLQCPLDVLSALKDKCVEAFGDPSSWTKDKMVTAGTVAATLNSTQLGTLSEDAVGYITPAAISLMPSRTFKVLSPAQLSRLGMENYAAVDDTQLDMLDPSQIEALNYNTGATTPYRADSGSSSAAHLRAAMAPFLLTVIVLAY
ncbi:otoancorin-like [Amia ocellicauda]|uniref:otoancorin-like n=1 Tax=Amia ocellicauda TaxID=2972642 RepID=UPI0034646DD4